MTHTRETAKKWDEIQLKNGGRKAQEEELERLKQLFEREKFRW